MEDTFLGICAICGEDVESYKDYIIEIQKDGSLVFFHSKNLKKKEINK